jgi:transcription termination/antitermination protein NusA
MFISYVCDAIVNAYKKRFPEQDAHRVRGIFDPATGEIGIFAAKKVVIEVNNEPREVSLTDARTLIPDVTLGETIEVEVTPADYSEFGRIVARVTKKLKAGRMGVPEGTVRKEYNSRKGTCTTGQIERIEDTGKSGKNIIVNLGLIKGQIPPSE